MSHGPNYIRLILPQIFLLFKSHFHITNKISFVSSSHQIISAAYSQVRENSLNALYLFLGYNKELLNTELIDKILPFLNQTISFLEEAQKSLYLVKDNINPISKNLWSIL